jgi:hypothetical protein
MTKRLGASPKAYIPQTVLAGGFNVSFVAEVLRVATRNKTAGHAGYRVLFLNLSPCPSLVYKFEVIKFPGLFDVALERPVETEHHEKPFIGIGLDPVISFVLGCLRAK